MARLSRVERRAQTREKILATARRVFLRRGFHAATLDEIAEEAGYSKGAVYSNFAAKDDLFLAVFDENIERRRVDYACVALDAATFEEGVRAVARHMQELARRDPEWQPLVVEFWTHACRSDTLRARMLRRRERVLETQGAIIADLAARHGVTLLIPAEEIVRGASAIGRGLALDQALDPASVPAALFERMFAAFINGVTTRGDPDEHDDGRADGRHH
ncbi:MAG TPA: helix-turn-helix domain-containing protein [Gaiellales bacterium]|jgi:AcrR family transcriptional regulator|nr:helix-turn-helix domain-containing protein [Gaiellales bacterium]